MAPFLIDVRGLNGKFICPRDKISASIFSFKIRGLLSDPRTMNVLEKSFVKHYQYKQDFSNVNKVILDVEVAPTISQVLFYPPIEKV